MMSALLTALFLASVLSVAPTAHAMKLPTAGASPFTLSGSVSSLVSPQAYNGAISTSQTVRSLQQLTSIHYYIVRGQLSSDGKYHYRYRVTTQPGIHVQGIELAANQQTHTQLIAVGIPARTPQSRTAQPHAASGPFDTSLHLWWYDPAHIHMMDVYDNMQWSSVGNGSTVAIAYTNDYENNFWDGWSEYSHHYAIGVAGGTDAYDYTYNTYFVNNLFCTLLTGNSGNPTFIYVYENDVDGYVDGTDSHYIDTTTSGGCSNLLNYSWSGF